MRPKSLLVAAPPIAGSKTERQELGAARCVAVDQRAQADLVCNARTGEGLGQNTDHDAKHGRAPVKAFCLLELLHVDLLGGPVLEPLVARLGAVHRV